MTTLRAGLLGGEMLQILLTKSKSLLVLTSLITISFAINCSRGPDPESNNAASPASNKLAQSFDINREDALVTEKFREREVAAKEILFKFEPCATEDRGAFLQRVTAFARDVTKDNQMIVSQVGNGCWFLAQSSRLTVSQLFDPFQSKIQLNLAPGANEQSPQVVAVEPNFVIRLKPQPGDMAVAGPPEVDYFKEGKLWGLQNVLNPGIDVDAIQAWGLSKGSKQIVVGVIDTGIDYDHPDLRGNVWSAPEDFKITLGTEEITCLKGSHGYNVWGKTDKERCDPMDGMGTTGHGT